MKIFKLALLFILLFAPSAFADMYYNIGLNYSLSKGTFSLASITLGSIGPDNRIQTEDFTAKLIAFNSSELYALNFSMYFEVPHMIETPPENIKFNLADWGEDSVTLYVPYFSTAQKLDIYDSYDDKLVFTVDLTEYAQCNQNGVCDLIENKDYCEDDCVKKSLLPAPVAKPKVEVKPNVTNVTTPVAPVEKEPVEEEKEEKKWSIMEILFIPIVAISAIIILSLLIVIIVVAAMKNKKPPMPPRPAYYR